MSMKKIQVEFTEEELRVLVQVLEHNPKAAYAVTQGKGGHVEHRVQMQLTDRLVRTLTDPEVR